MPDDFDYSASVRRDRSKADSPPLVTIVLIVLCVLLTLVYFMAGDDKSSALYKIAHAVLLSPDQIWSGRYWGLFTSFFIHLDILHLAFNMYWTWLMGSTLEKTIPVWKYLLFLVVSTMVGSCCELLVSGQTGAGASGAGYALMGLLWAGRGFHDSWRRLATLKNMQAFLVWGVLCIFLTVTGTKPIANGAHCGGLLFGLAVGHLFFSPRRRPVWSAVLVLLALACGLALFWIPWSSTWNWYKGTTAFDRHHYRDAITFYERGLRTGGQQGPLLYNIALSRYFLTTDALDSDKVQADRELKALDDQFNRAFAAAKAAAPPPSDANAATGDPQMNHLEKLKAKLDQVFSPSDSKKGH